MVKKAPESKQKKAAKIASGSSKEKKKWSGGKSKDIKKRQVHIDQELFTKVEKEATKANVIISTMIAEKFDLNVGCAQKLLEYLHENNIIRLIDGNGKRKVYGRIPVEKAKEETEAVAAAEE